MHTGLLISLLFGLALTGGAAQADGIVIAPSNAALLYSPYNWLVTGTAAKTINPGAYFRTLLVATHTCTIRLTVGPATPYSQVYARLDGGAWQKYVPTASGPQTWALQMPSSTSATSHLLEFVVKSATETQDRWESQATAVQVTGLTLDPGGSVARPASRRYRVLIYGDSITEGVRVNGYKDIAHDTDRNDATTDYAFRLGELLDAEIGVVGFGATGLTRAGSGSVPALPLSYDHLWSGQARAFSPVPDLVIYNEGTNDGKAAIGPALQEVIRGIGYVGVANTFAGLNGTRHLVLRPFNGNQEANLSAAVRAIGSPNVAYGDTTGFWSPDEASDGVHPYASAHLANIAPQVAALALPLLHPTGGARPR